MSVNQSADQLLATKAKFEIVWETLMKMGVATVTVSFDGSGDSGEITGCYPDAHDEAFQTHEVSLDIGKTILLSKLIEQLSDPLINGTGVDWYNNDGGFGEVIWHVAADETPPSKAEPEPLVYLNQLPPDENQPEPMGHYIELNISERIVNTVDHAFEFDHHGGRN